MYVCMYTTKKMHSTRKMSRCGFLQLIRVLILLGDYIYTCTVMRGVRMARR